MALIRCQECGKEISDRAAACPGCGCPVEQTLPAARITASVTPSDGGRPCPSCKSPNTQTIKLMCMMGTTETNSTAIGLSSQMDLFAANLNSNSRTTLAASYLPGPEPASSQFGGVAFGMLAALFAFGGVSAMLAGKEGGWFVLAIAIAIGLFAKYFPFENYLNAWKEKQRVFDSGWICHHCGHTWIP